MRLELQGVSRRPDWPRWAVICGTAWAALQVVGLLLARRLNVPGPFCLFRKITHLPCPTCGLTRGMLAVVGGHPLRAWTYNPLMFSCLAVLGVIVCVQVVFGRSVRLQLTLTERRIGWVCLLAMFAANWAYMILCVG